MVCEVEEEEEKEEDEGLCDLGVKALRGILQPPLDMNLIILLVMCLIFIFCGVFSYFIIYASVFNAM